MPVSCGIGFDASVLFAREEAREHPHPCKLIVL